MKKPKQVTLAQLRTAKGYSQKDFASVLNMSASAIAMYETGQRTPTLSRAITIASYFGIPLENIKFDSRVGV